MARLDATIGTAGRFERDGARATAVPGLMAIGELVGTVTEFGSVEQAVAAALAGATRRH